MNGEEEQAHRYRQRAEELRIIAEDMSNPETRRMLIGVAEDYVAMAETLDRIIARRK